MNLSPGALSSVLAAASWGDLLSFIIRMTLIAVIGSSICALWRQASAAARHLIAMATLVCMIGLPIAAALLPSVPLRILPVARPSSTVASPPVMAEALGTSEPLPASAYEAHGRDIVRQESHLRSGMSLTALALLFVAGMAAALLLHVFISLIAAWSTVRRARRIEDAALRSDLAAACERLGAPRGMDLRESPGIGVPVVWGAARPVLLLPEGARHWTREQLRIVFLHEAAHVVRHDWISLLLARVATSLFWFHPLVWMLARVARQECERCCDDLVLASGERATDYAAHLLAIVRAMRRSDPLARMVPALAQRSTLENRLAAILASNQRRGSISRSRLIATSASAVLLLVGTAAVQVVHAQLPADRAADRGKAAAPCPGTSDTAPGIEEGGIDLPAPSESTDEGVRAFRTGQEAFQKGRYVRAASSYLTAAALGFEKSESLYRAACALARAGATEDALNTLEAAITAGFDRTDRMESDENLASLRSDPRFVALLNLRLASVPEPAAVSVPVAVSVPAAVAEAIVAQPTVVLHVFENAGSRSQDKGKELGASAIELMRAGKYDRAIAAFEEEIRVDGSSNARYNLACAYALRGDKGAAFQALERAIANGFNDAQHMTQDEDLRLLQDDPRFYGLVRLTQELQIYGPGRSGLNDKEDWRKALPRFERIAHEHPKLGRAWANLGYARLESGDPRGAAEAYRKALDADYQPPLVMYNLACCASRSGDLDEAFQWLDRADKAGFEVGSYMAGDSDLDALRDDSRFKALLDRWDEEMAKQHREKDREKSY